MIFICSTHLCGQITQTPQAKHEAETINHKKIRIPKIPLTRKRALDSETIRKIANLDYIANYNVGVVVNYGNSNPNCNSNIFPAIDNDASPGFDISFNNCDYPCNMVAQDFTTAICDLKNDEKEILNLSQYNLDIANSLSYNFKYYR